MFREQSKIFEKWIIDNQLLKTDEITLLYKNYPTIIQLYQGGL